jgi:hypothetical protein
MATLSLNTSITSSHRDDFYTGVFNDGTTDWAAIYNLTYRVYRISATKNTLSGIKDETIPNQQDYASTVQLACPANINRNLVVA